MLLKLLIFYIKFLTGIIIVNGLEYRIGIIQGIETMSWHNARHSIDEWNNANTLQTGISLTLMSPSDTYSNIDDRICDILQRKIVAIIISIETETIDDILMSYSMCDRFRIPCITTTSINFLSNSKFLTSILPNDYVYGKATSELIKDLGWNTFLFIYQDIQSINEVTDLLSTWYNQQGTRTLLKVLQIPGDLNHYEIFLKYIREKLKITNIVIHTRDVGIIHSILSSASFLNMTESKYSYIFTNPDLILLDDFFESLNKIYKCNITGFQFVRHDPVIKSSLALTIDSIKVIGTSLTSLYNHGNMPMAESLICDTDDSWSDGDLLNEAIRQVMIDNSLTGKIAFKNTGKRVNTTLMGITRSNGRFHKLGIYDESKNKWNFESEYNTKWKFNINGTTKNLSGQKLKIVIYLEEPFVMKNEKNGIGYDGFCIDLLIEISKILNFTFEIIEVEDGAYGVEDETGQWNGIIGVLQRNEADLSISALTITYSRVRVVDFTLPFMHLGIAILIGTNIQQDDNLIQKSNLFTFMEPLSLTVWIALAFSYFCVGLAMCILARFSPYEWFDVDKRDRSMDNHKNQFDLLNSLWFATGSLMHQGSDVIPRAAATRTVAIIWWLFTLIIFSSYTAQLAAFLTAERMSTPIESAGDLVNQQKIKFGTLKNGSTMAFFRDSQIPIYERMWSIMESQSPTAFVNNSKEAIARVKAGNYAYMMESSMLEYYMRTDCTLQTIGGLLDSKGYGIALPKGSPLRNILSKTVLQLQERTILEALKNKWWESKHEASDCPESSDPHKVLDRVLGIFYVLLTGLIVSILMACGEYCIESKQKSIRLNLTWLGKLIKWWNTKNNKNNDQQLIINRNKLCETRLDNITTIDINGKRNRQSPKTSKQKREHGFLFDEKSDITIADSFTDIQRRRSQNKDEFRKISRLIPPRDEALISRRISTISR